MTESKSAEGVSEETALDSSEPGVAEELLDEEEQGAAAGETSEAALTDSSGMAEELQALKDKHLRLAAEYDNFRKRTVREKQDLARYGKSDVFEKLLPVVDALERGIHANVSEDSIDTVKQGLEKVYQQLIEVLQREGVQSIEQDKIDFDPQVHMAVMQEPSEELEPDMVLQVFEKGWRLEDKILRPAKVKVSASA